MSFEFVHHRDARIRYGLLHLGQTRITRTERHHYPGKYHCRTQELNRRWMFCPYLSGEALYFFLLSRGYRRLNHPGWKQEETWEIEIVISIGFGRTASDHFLFFYHHHRRRIVLCSALPTPHVFFCISGHLDHSFGTRRCCFVQSSPWYGVRSRMG